MRGSIKKPSRALDGKVLSLVIGARWRRFLHPARICWELHTHNHTFFPVARVCISPAPQEDVLVILRKGALGLAADRIILARRDVSGELVAAMIFGPIWLIATVGMVVLLILLGVGAIPKVTGIWLLIGFGSALSLSTLIAFLPFVPNPVGMSLTHTIRVLKNLVLGRK